MTHPMQHLIRQPITGDVPETDPHYGWMYTLILAIDNHAADILEEVEFDGIATEADGTVHLTRKGTPVASARMSDHHADARLVLGDPT